MVNYLLLFLCAIGLSTGQVLFKKSANLLSELESPWMLLFQIPFIAGISAYAITTIVWVWALQTIPLGRAYMVMSLAFIIVPLLGHYVFGETLTLRFGFGVLLILSGVFLTLKS